MQADNVKRTPNESVLDQEASEAQTTKLKYFFCSFLLHHVHSKAMKREMEKRDLHSVTHNTAGQQ